MKGYESVHRLMRVSGTNSGRREGQVRVSGEGEELPASAGTLFLNALFPHSVHCSGKKKSERLTELDHTGDGGQEREEGIERERRTERHEAEARKPRHGDRARQRGMTMIVIPVILYLPTRIHRPKRMLRSGKRRVSFRRWRSTAAKSTRYTCIVCHLCTYFHCCNRSHLFLLTNIEQESESSLPSLPPRKKKKKSKRPAQVEGEEQFFLSAIPKNYHAEKGYVFN